ncbi:MAG: hypothetical protein HY586_05835, partial [Candidatus Omnitrophica bacterium]|nr:hypothetical protein [Candidatus Omnitrophota bacterium]
LLINRKVPLANPAILDMAPTLLAVFDIEKDPEMDGKALFGAKDLAEAKLPLSEQMAARS